MRRIGLLLTMFAPVAPGQAHPDRAGPAELLRSWWDPDRLWRPEAGGNQLVVATSHDRRSDSGPEVADDWYANEDSGRYLRIDVRDGRPEYVLADVEGPGAIARIWVAEPRGVLWFAIDGQEARGQWELNGLTSTEPPGPSPLVVVQPGGLACTVPLPFARRLVVSSSDPGLRYELVIRRLPAAPSGIPARMPGGPELQQAAADVGAWPDRTPTATAGGDLRDGPKLELPGPCIVRELRVSVAPARGVPRAAALRRTLLVLIVDGHETARVPLGDFFGSAPDPAPFTTRMLRLLPDGTLACRWPIPARQELIVQLRGEGDGAVGTGSLVVVRDPADLPEDYWTLHAGWHQQRGVPSRPFRDHLLLDAGGPGRLAGTALVVHSSVKSWWGEGDPKLYVDGEAMPSWFGTGTDAHFGFSADRTPRFVAALGGIVQRDGPGSLGYTTLVRLHAGDDVAFARSLRFELELLHRHETAELDIASTVWWYAPPAAASGLPAVSPVGERLLRAVEVPPVRRVPGAIEAEDLQVLGRPSGRVSREEMAAFDGGWSDGTQLAWRGAEPGDRLELALPVPAPGKYRLRAVFTQAPDQGQVQVLVGGKPVGSFLDLHGLRTRPGDEVDFGVVELAAGQARLGIELVGRGVRARPEYGVGLDYVRLEPIR